ncbi:MAG: SpoIID/LytB domain-containing protein [Acidobacteriaceae bacterium]|nr:SpoIID/LytB domain-containing protein [Acidobacteriaceae bacterium]
MKRLSLFALALASLCSAHVTYKVRLSTGSGKVVELSSEQYVAGVLAGESSTFRGEESLKAMAIAARTYAARLRGRHASDGYDFCDATHCQRFELEGSATTRFMRAAAATAGELLWFKGQLAFTPYTRDCGGQTESVQYVWPDVQAPYLSSQADPFCARAGSRTWSWCAPLQQIAAALHASNLNAPNHLSRIVAAETTPSRRILRLQLIGDGAPVLLSASSFRFALGRALGWNTLRSERYAIDNRGGLICFHGTGEGHGVGLCQTGADEMALEGHTYREILAFYYPGAVIAQTAEGFAWTRMSGETVTVFSTNPDRDHDVLRRAEALNKTLAARLHWQTPQVTIRVYPDVAAFRNATGEPGWVAAHASRLTIDLQPSTLLEGRAILTQTLRHELLHIYIERQAAPGLPLWFREGLVEYLAADESSPPHPSTALDADLAQRRDRSRAEAAYAAARARVLALMNRYGEATVFAWLARGLPDEVKNSTASSPPANNK